MLVVGAAGGGCGSGVFSRFGSNWFIFSNPKNFGIKGLFGKTVVGSGIAEISTFISTGGSSTTIRGFFAGGDVTLTFWPLGRSTYEKKSGFKIKYF